jgi:hypothetical protein
LSRGRATLSAIGGVAAFIALAAGVADIAIGIALQGQITAGDHGAAARLMQLTATPLLGLYLLDLLNLAVSFVMLAAYIALERALDGSALARTGLIVYSLGTAIFASANAALPMLGLSAKFAAAAGEAERVAIVAATESLLARGEHGSPGALPGFLISSIAGIIMSLAMAKGKRFGRLAPALGIAGGAALSAYLAIVTFVPGAGSLMIALALPGGLANMGWLGLIGIKLLKPVKST